VVPIGRLAGFFYPGMNRGCKGACRLGPRSQEEVRVGSHKKPAGGEAASGYRSNHCTGHIKMRIRHQNFASRKEKKPAHQPIERAFLGRPNVFPRVACFEGRPIYPFIGGLLEQLSRRVL